MKALDIKNITISIIDIFEDVLEEKNITIPDEFREGNSDEARIFGDTYYRLEESIMELLTKTLTK